MKKTLAQDLPRPIWYFMSEFSGVWAYTPINERAMVLKMIEENTRCDYTNSYEPNGDLTMIFQRITTNPEVCGGKPCIRGLRFPVSRLLGLLASGESPESILKSYNYLESEDILEALRYAAFIADEQIIEFAQ